MTALEGMHHRPFLLVAAVLGVVLGVLHNVMGLEREAAVLMGWCLATIAYAVPTCVIMRRATPDSMRRMAEAVDSSETAVLAASIAAAVASLVAVAWFLAVRGSLQVWEGALTASAIGLSWVFIHLMFAVRYAHEYWQAGGRGVEFPGDEAPRFGDFLYVSFTMGMTFQTSDVAFTARAMRRLALVHGLVSFLFNVVILAAAVNLAAGLAS